jgi:hypothetical protein
MQSEKYTVKNAVEQSCGGGLLIVVEKRKFIFVPKINMAHPYQQTGQNSVFMFQLLYFRQQMKG